MPFAFESLALPEVVVITPTTFEDSRGSFEETYRRSEFARAGITADFLQDNRSVSRRGVVRGLHYQLEPFAQGKLLRALSGSLFEVALDVRRGSPDFGKWVGVTLSASNRKILWIPPGFAAGMVALEEGTQLAYKTTKEYSKPHERGIAFNDPEIRIEWPVDLHGAIVSEKDLAHPRLRDAELNFVYRAPPGRSDRHDA